MTWSKWREWFQWRQACSLSALCCDGFVKREYRIREEKNSFSRIEKNRELNARKLEFVETGNVRMRLRVSSSAISRQMSVYRGKTMNRGVRTCVRANAWPGVGISQTRMWILFAHPYDKVHSSYCFPSAKWYLKPFAKTSPTGLSPYRRDYIGYVCTYASMSLFPLLFSSFISFTGLTGKQASSGERNAKLAWKKRDNIIYEIEKPLRVHVKTREKQNSISGVILRIGCAM